MDHVELNSSNRSIETRVRNAFEKLGYPQLMKIEIHHASGVLTLQGSLQSFYLTQIAQTVAIKIEGVKRVINQLKVE
ncbi:MAG: BON domain-containing protein [Planctomycetota bacterium]